MQRVVLFLIVLQILQWRYLVFGRYIRIHCYNLPILFPAVGENEVRSFRKFWRYAPVCSFLNIVTKIGP